MMSDVKNAAKIKLLALDVDGVLTDGSLNIGAEGELFKAFNARDGLGLSCLLRSGVRVAIITGRKSAIIHRRAEELGITELYEWQNWQSRAALRVRKLPIWATT